MAFEATKTGEREEQKRRGERQRERVSIGELIKNDWIRYHTQFHLFNIIDKINLRIHVQNKFACSR